MHSTSWSPTRSTVPAERPRAGQRTRAHRATQQITILLVEPDELLREIIEAGFRLFEPDFEILLAADLEAAEEAFLSSAVDLVISEITFPGQPRSGIEFLATVKRRMPQLPVLILTEPSAEGFQSLAQADAFIAKPPDMDYLLRKVQKAIQQQRESVVRGISLESFLQVLEVEKKTCTLTIVTEAREGSIFVCDGELIHAETGQLEAKAALFEILCWQDYSIKVREKCNARTTIADRLNAILMEWCVEKDHGRL